MKNRIVNMVAIVKLSTTLDLAELATAFSSLNASISGNRWLKLRLMPENHYVAFYKSGKFLITGINSLEEVQKIKEKVLHLLREAGVDVSVSDTTIHNIVMTGFVKINTSLEKIIFSVDDSKSSYEPEQFPGMIYRDFGVSFLLFPGGKFVLTGAKDIISAEEAAKKFIDIIENIY